MDTFTDSGPEEALSLGAKNRKPFHDFKSCPFESNGDIGVEVASKYIGKGPGSYSLQGPKKSVNNSSDDDSDTEFSSMTLVALAAKHKNNKLLYLEKKSVSVSSTNDSPVQLITNSLIDSSDSSSDNEDSSLLALMKKHKFEDTCEVDGCIHIDVEKQKSINLLHQSSVRPFDDFKHGAVNDILVKEIKTIGIEEMTTKFVAANFSDDSDSEEPSFLVDLALRQSKNSYKDGSHSRESTDNVKPSVKELQKLVNYHRQHTKSESDRFSPRVLHPLDNLLEKGLVSNISTSLISLRGGDYNDSLFKFSPGGSIPGSFKELNVSNSLNSSQASVGVEASSKGLGSYNDIDLTYSDSDVIISSRHFDNRFGKSRDTKVLKDSLPFFTKAKRFFPPDVVDGGINLSCALKESTSARTSESLMSEDSVEILGDAEDEEIVTLLDSMVVDDVDDGKIKKRLLSNSELDESCMIDASCLLKVRINLRTRKCSSFGKVVCRLWKPSKTPYIRKDKLKTNVIPFHFKEPSPDDVIAYAFKRRP